MENSTLTITHIPVTEDQFLAALEKFAKTSVGATNVQSTYDALVFLTGIIESHPDTYQKIFKPENQQKFKDIINQYSGTKKPGLMDLITLVPTITEIFA